MNGLTWGTPEFISIAKRGEIEGDVNDFETLPANVCEIVDNHEFRKKEGWEQTLLVENIDEIITYMKEQENRLHKIDIENARLSVEYRRMQIQNKRYQEAIDNIMMVVNEHISDGTEINPYKIDVIVDELEVSE